MNSNESKNSKNNTHSDLSRKSKEDLYKLKLLLESFGVVNDGSELYKNVISNYNRNRGLLYSWLSILKDLGSINSREILTILDKGWPAFVKEYGKLVSKEHADYSDKSSAKRYENNIERLLKNKYVYNEKTYLRDYINLKKELEENKKRLLTEISHGYNGSLFSVGEVFKLASEFEDGSSILPKGKGPERKVINGEKQSGTFEYSKEKFKRGMATYSALVSCAMEASGARVIETPNSNGGNFNMRKGWILKSYKDEKSGKVVMKEEPIEGKASNSSEDFSNYYCIQVGKYLIIEPQHNEAQRDYANATYVMPIDRYYEFVKWYGLKRKVLSNIRTKAEKENGIEDLLLEFVNDLIAKSNGKYKKYDSLSSCDQVTVLRHSDSAVVRDIRNIINEGQRGLAYKKDKEFNPYLNALKFTYLIKFLSEQTDFVDKETIRKAVSKKNILRKSANGEYPKKKDLEEFLQLGMEILMDRLMEEKENKDVLSDLEKRSVEM